MYSNGAKQNPIFLWSPKNELKKPYSILNLTVIGICTIIVLTTMLWFFFDKIETIAFAPVPVSVPVSENNKLSKETLIIYAEQAGTIEHIFVNDNEDVKEGQILLSFSANNENNELAALQQKRDELNLKILCAEALAKGTFLSGDELGKKLELLAPVNSSNTSNSSSALAQPYNTNNENITYRSHLKLSREFLSKASFNLQAKLQEDALSLIAIKENIIDLQVSLNAIEKNLSYNKQKLGSLNEDIKTYEILKKATNKDLNDAADKKQDHLKQLIAEHEDYGSKVADLQSKKNEVAEKIAVLQDNYLKIQKSKQDAINKEIAHTQEEIAKIDLQERALNEKIQNSSLKARANAKIKNIYVKSGSVTENGQKILELIPY